MTKKLIGLIALATLFAGCSTLNPTGVYQGDKVLYNADLSIRTSYDVIHTFVTWEKANRPALAGLPAVTDTANNMRKNAKTWIASAIACRDTYAMAPNEGNYTALQKALAILQTAVNQSAQYLAQSVKPL